MVVSATAPALSSVQFDASLVRKLSQGGPCYTSYPTADRFSDQFGYRDYLQAVAHLRTRGSGSALSLYLHIPFCGTACPQCPVDKAVGKNRDKAVTYLAYLKREIEMQGKLFTGMNRVDQLHVGGGPTYLSDAQMDDLMAHLRHWFQFAPGDSGDYLIEVDPRTVSPARIHTLRSQGFNRISLGAHDVGSGLEPCAGPAPEGDTLAVVAAARKARFRSVSVDLVYGLPGQTAMRMAHTLGRVLEAEPDRIALYDYTCPPQPFKPQRRAIDAELPSIDTRLDMLSLCIRRLQGAGYEYIGMDHFAKPSDELAVAQRQGRLHRNCQGYSTHADADLVACGVSAISAIGATYSQNVKTLDAYYARLDQDELPIERGIRLGMDDALRRAVIQTLMCSFELSIPALELAWPIAFARYFAPELEKLQALAQDGLLTIDADWLTASPKGRLLIRNICMVFDRYLTGAADAPRLSATV